MSRHVRVARHVLTHTYRGQGKVVYIYMDTHVTPLHSKMLRYRWGVNIAGKEYLSTTGFDTRDKALSEGLNILLCYSLGELRQHWINPLTE